MEAVEMFRSKIKRTFRKPGEEWLEHLGEIIEKCIEKWGLTELVPSSNMSFNYLCFGKSPEFGEVALKVGFPHPELFSEMTALSLYAGRGMCKCYGTDNELGAILIERIMPGEELTVIKNSSERIKRASQIIAELPREVEDGRGLPKYSDWIGRAFKRARKEGRVGERMVSYIDRAEEMFKELEAKKEPQVLLHGDLHHMNILQGREGWKAIDPKGVIGLRHMEAARFMENEIDMVEEAERFNCLKEMIEVFSDKFLVSKCIMAQGLFIDNVLSTCWCFEDDCDPDELKKPVDDCEFFLNYYNALAEGKD